MGFVFLIRVGSWVGSCAGGRREGDVKGVLLHRLGYKTTSWVLFCFFSSLEWEGWAWVGIWVWMGRGCFGYGVGVGVFFLFLFLSWSGLGWGRELALLFFCGLGLGGFCLGWRGMWAGMMGLGCGSRKGAGRVVGMRVGAAVGVGRERYGAVTLFAFFCGFGKGVSSG